MEMGEQIISYSIQARKAAFTLESKLGIPGVELTRVYEIDRIKRQCKAFARLWSKIDIRNTSVRLAMRPDSSAAVWKERHCNRQVVNVTH